MVGDGRAERVLSVGNCYRDRVRRPAVGVYGRAGPHADLSVGRVEGEVFVERIQVRPADRVCERVAFGVDCADGAQGGVRCSVLRHGEGVCEYRGLVEQDCNQGVLGGLGGRLARTLSV